MRELKSNYLMFDENGDFVPCKTNKSALSMCRSMVEFYLEDAFSNHDTSLYNRRLYLKCRLDEIGLMALIIMEDYCE